MLLISAIDPRMPQSWNEKHHWGMGWIQIVEIGFSFFRNFFSHIFYDMSNLSTMVEHCNIITNWEIEEKTSVNFRLTHFSGQISGMYSPHPVSVIALFFFPFLAHPILGMWLRNHRTYVRTDAGSTHVNCPTKTIYYVGLCVMPMCQT